MRLKRNNKERKMRTIKFRAKRNDMDRWVYGDYFKTPLTDENSKADIKDGHFYLCGVERDCIRQEHGVSFVIEEKTLGQFTGLTDKNGKEIYEGDICNAYAKLYGHSEALRVKIEYNSDKGRFEPLQYWKDKGVWMPFFSCFEDYNFEIIGNIHENSELINPNT